MKIRVLDRILVAVAGLLILAMCAGILAQVFFNVDIVGKAAEILTKDIGWVRAAIAVVCVLLMLIGAYCVLVLFRHRRRKDKFILQKTESGDLAISLKALESMVSRCLEERQEIETQAIRLENQKDGLNIVIRGTVASGISIPLTVDTLQKQIRQYVTACSGVEVKNIRVQIESSGEEAKNAPFAIDAPAPTPLLQSAEKAAEKKEEEKPVPEPEPVKAEEPKPETETEEAAPAVKSSAESAMEAVENLRKEYEEEVEDDRPIHQRLFSTPEEPCIMPMPPEDLVIDNAGQEVAPEAAEEEEPLKKEADEAEAVIEEAAEALIPDEEEPEKKPEDDGNDLWKE